MIQAKVRRVKIKDGPDPIDVLVGLNLRRARLAREISQSELADALGITFQQIQKYERAANRVSASMLVKAARFLGVSAATLLPDLDDASDPVDAGQHADVGGAAEMLNAYGRIANPALRGLVLSLTRELGPKASPVRIGKGKKPV